MKASSASSTIECRLPRPDLFLRFLTERLDGAHHVTDADLGGRTGQAHAAMAAAYGGKEAGLRQQMHDFEGVLLGDVQALGDFRDLDQPAFGLGAIDEDPNGVARGFVEAHADPNLGPRLSQRYVTSSQLGNRRTATGPRRLSSLNAP